MQVDIRDLSRGPQTVEHQRTFPQTGSVLDTGALLRIADAQEKLVEHHKSIDETLGWLLTVILVAVIVGMFILIRNPSVLQ